MTIIKRIAKLIDVKSLTTMCLTVVFSYLSIKGVITGEQFLTIYSVIISFFFGVKVGKAEKEDELKDETEKPNDD